MRARALWFTALLAISLAVYGPRGVRAEQQDPQYDEFGLVPGEGSGELSLDDDYLNPDVLDPHTPAEVVRERRRHRREDAVEGGGDVGESEDELEGETDEPGSEESAGFSSEFHEDNWDRDEEPAALPPAGGEEDDGGDDIEDW